MQRKEPVAVAGFWQPSCMNCEAGLPLLVSGNRPHSRQMTFKFDARKQTVAALETLCHLLRRARYQPRAGSAVVN
jgi:hypothetical protein